MPPISAMRVSRVTTNDASRFSSPAAGPEPLADEVEGGPAADRGDPAGHLGEHADADDADDDDPGQRHPEPGADHGVGDEVADVDEPADRGEDAEHDSEEPLHPYRLLGRLQLGRALVQVDDRLAPSPAGRRGGSRSAPRRRRPAASPSSCSSCGTQLVGASCPGGWTTLNVCAIGREGVLAGRDRDVARSCAGGDRRAAAGS